MKLRRIGQLTRRSADRALSRSGTSGIANVDRLLAAATAPASGFELNREAEMVAQFRFIASHGAAAAHRATFAQAVRARLVAAKAAIAITAAIALAGGGVAFAASTGNLPQVLGGDHRSPTGAAHSSQAPGQTKGPNDPEPTSSDGPKTPSGTPSPSLKGLCHAFQAGVATNPGKALSNPAFTALATAAGGKANMAAFCVSLIGAPAPKPTHGPTAEPTHPAHPTNTPNPNKPTKTPDSNRPTSHPTTASSNSNQ